MREEPVVYINGKPFVLREVERPYKNMLEYTGIDCERVERMEARLKDDILREAERYEGAIMVIHENDGGQISDAWEHVKLDVVQTPREVLTCFEADGFPIKYARVPITDGKSPKGSDFDTLAMNIVSASKDTAFVFNCQMGIGRTTTGTEKLRAPHECQHGDAVMEAIVKDRNGSVLGGSKHCLAGKKLDLWRFVRSSGDTFEKINVIYAAPIMISICLVILPRRVNNPHTVNRNLDTPPRCRRLRGSHNWELIQLRKRLPIFPTLAARVQNLRILEQDEVGPSAYQPIISFHRPIGPSAARRRERLGRAPPWRIWWPWWRWPGGSQSSCTMVGPTTTTSRDCKTKVRVGARGPQGPGAYAGSREGSSSGGQSRPPAPELYQAPQSPYQSTSSRPGWPGSSSSSFSKASPPEPTQVEAVMEQLVKLYKESHLGKRLPVYDGIKSLYAVGPLPFVSKEFRITLLDEDDGAGRPDQKSS
ncbi:Unknown protein [Striga hermonthica]|uniref:Protein argonaute N-terminal domain-containing protein n=1 Tax=Striga hermonthica TaxID=68872 RepID=A0A9N7RU16_STRHE|nr:Unknown protein [Striga hermonthica]